MVENYSALKPETQTNTTHIVLGNRYHALLRLYFLVLMLRH